MSGRIFIVESVATRRAMLRDALTTAFMEVQEWTSGTNVWSTCDAQRTDVVVCSEALAPNVLETKNTAISAAKDVPVLVVANSPDRAAQIAFLGKGAKDVTHPDEGPHMMVARVRRLLRQRADLFQLRKRCGAGTPFALQEAPNPFARRASVTIVSPSQAQGRAWATRLTSGFEGAVQAISPAELFAAGKRQALIVPGTEAGLAYLPDVLAHPETRDCATLVVSPPGRYDLAQRALDLGAGDVMSGGFDGPEATLRLRHLLGLKTTKDNLQAALSASVKAALSDPLTGLHNRRYAIPALEEMAAHASSTGTQFAVMLLDIDHFKAVNDTYGHPAGDAILTAFAERLRSNLRQIDLVARIGGEEFLVAMPVTDTKTARKAAERLRRVTTEHPFAIAGEDTLVRISISIGVTFGGTNPALCKSTQTQAQDHGLGPIANLLACADRALYRSKGNGRNRVTLSLSAA